LVTTAVHKRPQDDVHRRMPRADMKAALEYLAILEWRRVDSNHVPADYEVAVLALLHMCRKP